MVTITNASDALKSVYLGVIANQLNTKVNPLFNKIKQSTNDVWGKEIIKLAPVGINGGIGAGAEDGTLPTAAGNNYAKFTASLKNLFGTIEISDKALRASISNTGAFVNLLNTEMEGLVSASKFNFGRMLYGDGSGTLATVATVVSNVVTMSSVNNLVEGMVVDCYASGATSPITGMSGLRIATINRSTKVITFAGVSSIDNTFTTGGFLTLQGSKGKEITGLGAIYAETGDLYGLSKASYSYMNPQVDTTSVKDSEIQEIIDLLEEYYGSSVDFITMSYDMKTKYAAYLDSNSRNADFITLDDGYKAFSYSGIPMVADRFVPAETMYLLDTKEFTLHQLCDWQWLEDNDGNVLKQIANKAAYTATLVKYCDLICAKPAGQGKLTYLAEDAA